MSIAEKLLTIAENEQSISNGINTEANLIAEIQSIVDNLPTVDDDDDSYDDGYEAGRTAEYDHFWDDFQQNGNRTNYDYAFYRWSAENFKPKYPIKPTGGAATWFLNGSKVTDRQYLDLIDFSQITSVSSPFDNTIMPSFGVVDLSSVKANSTVTNLFRYNAVIHTIDKIVVHDTIKYSQWFTNCKSLENVTFEGVIGQDGLNFSWSPLLTNASVQSVIDHLKQLPDGTTYTITFHADVGEKMTDAQKAQVTAKNWTLAY